MSLINYLKDKIIDILLYIILIFLIVICLLVFKVNNLLIFYIVIMYISTILVILLHDYFKRRRFYKNTTATLNKLDKKYLIAEIIKKPNFIDGEMLVEYLYEINKSMIEEVNSYKYTTEDFKEYIELWCHEIKTPLAASEMIIHNNESKVTKDIEEELNRIENYIEQVLYYARSENVEKDYIITEVNLNNIVTNVIKKNKKTLIGNNIKVNININSIVNSDLKWLEFIINQIISNSIKYISDNPKIKIYSINNKNSIELYIEDNGIGINEADIAKVFDKGFTGSNGRKYNKSTGLGLYLCKTLCTKLGHNISIESKNGTTVKIVFPNSSYNNLTEM